MGPDGSRVLSWASATLLHATQPLNRVFRFAPEDYRIGSQIMSVSCFHPGGVNILMGDGSVRFVGDSLNIWSVRFNANRPEGSIQASDGFAFLPPAGVWQAYDTRAGGEVISAV